MLNHAKRCVWFVLLVLLSCSRPNGDDADTHARVSKIAQALTDSDGDGMDDAWETLHFGNLSQIGTDDFDADGMTNVEEYLHAFDPVVQDSLQDADGDRYPNVFEIRYGADPNSSSSMPTPTYVVNGAGGGTHTTIGAAVGAANTVNGAYQIIGIAPGVYTGSANLRDVTITATHPKLLIIGLEGAAKTVIDGGLTNYGWYVRNTVVISSLTFQKAVVALYLDAPSKDVRLVDLLVRDNIGSSWAAGVHVNSVGRVSIESSTFLDNAGGLVFEQIYNGSGAVTLVNTVVWGRSSGTMLGSYQGTTLTTNYCLVKGQTLTGTGNLAGSVDPKLRSDARLLWDSPLRSAGGDGPWSRVDIDGELRPSSAPDIGVDEFLDSDSDGLADQWEFDEAGNLTTLTSRTQDADGDGLTNGEEHAAYTKPLVADTDGDGLSDGDEVKLRGTNPLATDTDGDDMPDGWEIANGLAPLVVDGFDDADGDRYPNVFEYTGGTDPRNAGAIPTPTYVVNGAGGGTHTTIGAALAASSTVNGAYQIIGIAPGVYTGGPGLTGGPNLRDVTITATHPKLLVIGLAGAGKTVIDGGLVNYGWVIGNAAVISSLTFQKAVVALYVNAPMKEVRFVDLLVRDNVGPIWAGGIHVNAAAKVRIVGSTFFNNTGAATVGQQIWVGAGAATLINTAVWGTGSGTMLANAGGTTVTTSYCLVKGQTLTGTSNLAGSVDPKLRSDARLRSNSPLRGAGGSVAQSRIDLDGEQRPNSAPDIGVDQFVDVDSDLLPDAWEIASFGNTTAIAGSADQDNDGLSNAAEHDLETNWLDPDTDHDGINDGAEVALGTNPFVVDADEPAGDLNHDGLIDSIGAQLGYQPNRQDDDGDSIPNVDEALMCTNPLRADSDGDGVPDSADAFPLDPLVSALPSNPMDVTAPVITLSAPWYAVPQ